ncbi:Uncharacterized protein LOCC1_G004612 [Lachnellula occidentalis]|uniref:Uncharacterized protein n=1 Tax=Lachnellula occidentalis TaxID=215460 RepID=A0A8H8RX67_9HELO|nr:Uncharacterized protein LOCC1_G004612 [Lachnellula occidentalis]
MTPLFIPLPSRNKQEHQQVVSPDYIKSQTMPPKTDFPPIRACLFDLDGLLIDSEDKYTICTEAVLARYGKPRLPWSIKAKMQGRPGPAAGAIFEAWAQLPLTRAEYLKELVELQKVHFPTVKPLPGTQQLLGDLAGARSKGAEGGKCSGGGVRAESGDEGCLGAHAGLREEYRGKEKDVLAGRTGEGVGDLHQVGEVDDGWAEHLETLEDFPYEKYGIVV